ncbi:MAG: acyl-CoA dehydrogenase family protein [Novosphingobium sp.]
MQSTTDTISRTPVACTVDPVPVAASLVPLLAAHAEACEREGRIQPPVMAALREAGLFHITAPRRAGGPGGTLLTHVETVAQLAQGCVGTAWAFCLLSGVTGTVLGFPAAVTDIVFRTGDELLCSASAPTAKATPVPGGYRVTGKWGYGSGCCHADWALNGVQLLDAAGTVCEMAMVFIDLRDPACTVLDDWRVAGMAGSGSNTIVAEDLFVPEALILHTAQTPSAEVLLSIPGLEPRDLWPMESLFPLGVLPPMLGAATAILHAVVRSTGMRPVVGWTYDTQAASQTLSAMIGQSALEIDSAWMHIRRAVGMMDDTASQRPLTGFDKAQIQADCGFAMGLLRAAGNRLLDVAGPGAFALNNPLQRFWRDLNVGSRHNALSSHLSTELYGRALTGQPSNLRLLPDIGPAPAWASAA